MSRPVSSIRVPDQVASATPVPSVQAGFQDIVFSYPGYFPEYVSFNGQWYSLYTIDTSPPYYPSMTISMFSYVLVSLERGSSFGASLDVFVQRNGVDFASFHFTTAGVQVQEDIEMNPPMRPTEDYLSVRLEAAPIAGQFLGGICVQLRPA